MASISSIKLPNGVEYNLKDNGALQLTGGSVTGPVSFGDSVSIDEAAVGDLVVNGSASFTNNINANTINGVTVGSSPKFTDTVYSHPTYTAKSSGLYKITVDSTGHVSAATAVAKSDITGLGIPAQDTSYESKAAESGGTAVSLVTTGEKYTWNNKIGATTPTIATDTGTSAITLASAGKYKLTAGGGSVIFTMPTIPTVNNATLTIQKNGTTVKTFTANASSNVTANITVPTKVSELTNDSSFISSYTETDPIFTASDAYGITSTDITNWNNKSNLTIGTTATTAAAGNHTHTASLATDSGTSAITLASAGKYKLTAGGSSVIFTMPTIPTVPSSMSGTTASSTTGVSIGDHSSTTIYGVSSSTTTASKVTVGSHSTDYGVTAAGSGSFTQGSFSGGSGSFSATVTNHVLSFSHTHTAATHGTDSHTHTAPTLGSKVPTVSASNVTVPIKNSSTTTVVTSTTHTVTDNGHTHTVTVS